MSLAPDGNSIYFIASERGHHPIYKVATVGGAPKKIVDGVFATNLQIAPDGSSLVFAGSSLASPPDLYRVSQDGVGLTPLTRVNSEFMSRASLKEAEELEWNGAFGKKIHGFLLKPRNFNASNKYPLIILIHGDHKAPGTIAGVTDGILSYLPTPDMSYSCPTLAGR